MQRSETELRKAEMEQKLWDQRPHDQRLELARQMMRKIAKLDRSDPFVADRIFSRLMNGSSCPETFGFKMEVGNTFSGDGKRVSLS